MTATGDDLDPPIEPTAPASALSAAGAAARPGRSPSRLERAGAGADRLGYFPRWLILGVVIGIAAGLGAIAFYEALRLGSYLFLDLLGGYVVPTPLGEGGVVGPSGFSRPWAIPLTVGLGGLLSGLLVFGLAPEAEGHGCPGWCSDPTTPPRERSRGCVSSNFPAPRSSTHRGVYRAVPSVMPWLGPSASGVAARTSAG